MNEKIDEIKLYVDVLTKEFQNRFNEMIFHSQQYHKYINFLQIYTTLILAIVAFVFSDRSTTFIGNLSISTENLKYIFIMFLLFGISIGYFLVSSLLDSLFAIYMNGIGLSAVEKKINYYLKQDILIWDSKIIPSIHNYKFLKKSHWVKPHLLVGVWSIIIFLLLNISLVFLSYLVTPIFFSLFLPIVFILTVYHIYQWNLLNIVGIEEIKYKILKSHNFIINRKMTIKKIPAKYFIPSLTFLIGFLPMLLLSIQENTFGLGSNVDYPFLANISVLIGDSIIFPIFNYAIYVLYRVIRNTIKYKLLEMKMPYIYLSLFALSLIINILIHVSWITDQYNGFMDIILGELSWAGYWHLIFSTFEMFIVFVFLFFFILSLLIKHHVVLKALIRSNYIFLIFSSLSIFDFFIRGIFIYKRSIVDSSIEDLTIFSSFIISVTLMIILKYVNKRNITI